MPPTPLDIYILNIENLKKQTMVTFFFYLLMSLGISSYGTTDGKHANFKGEGGGDAWNTEGGGDAWNH